MCTGSFWEKAGLAAEDGKRLITQKRVLYVSKNGHVLA